MSLYRKVVSVDKPIVITLFVSAIFGVFCGLMPYIVTNTFKGRFWGLIVYFLLLFIGGFISLPLTSWLSVLYLYPTSLGFFFLLLCGGHIIKFKREIFPSYFFNKCIWSFRILGIFLITLGIIYS